MYERDYAGMPSFRRQMWHLRRPKSGHSRFDAFEARRLHGTSWSIVGGFPPPLLVLVRSISTWDEVSLPIITFEACTTLYLYEHRWCPLKYHPEETWLQGISKRPGQNNEMASRLMFTESWMPWYHSTSRDT